MKGSFLLLFILTINYISPIPVWDFSNSATDLFKNGATEVIYKIDGRGYWYGATDWLRKKLIKNSGEVTHENWFTVYYEGSGSKIYTDSTVEF